MAIRVSILVLSFGAQQYSVVESSSFPRCIRRGKRFQRTFQSRYLNISMLIRESENSADNKYGKARERACG